MITYEEALKKIENNVTPLSLEIINLEDAAYRILAEDIVARNNLPPFDNSAMDGYAVCVGDVKSATESQPVQLKIKHVVKAGALANKKLNAGEAVKIMTGAPIPPGADAVVMKELTEEINGTVKILRAPRKGENIRSYGEDMKTGQIALKKGIVLRPYEIALLAAQGIVEIPVVCQPKVGIIATGDELVEIDQELTHGKIRNSNGIALSAAIAHWGGQPIYKGIVNDNPETLSKVLQGSIGECDVLLVTGGVSVGDFDYTKSALEKLGMETIFWKVAIKPGKPLLFGVYWPTKILPLCKGELEGVESSTSPIPSLQRRGISEDSPNPERSVLVFGLPGNPVSALVCLEEFVRPALEKMQGKSWHVPSYHLNGILDEDCVKDPKRLQFLFSQVRETTEGFSIHVIRPQGSAMIGMACSANALAVVPTGTDFVKKGSVISFRWLK